MAKKYTIFFSDIHLDPGFSETTDWFLNFLQNETAQNADAIYILGDLFEAWLGDDDTSIFCRRIKSAILTASQSCPVYLMHGNRDFLIGQQFSQDCQLQLIPDPFEITLYQQKILLMHGDTLCVDDIAYQQARQRFTSEKFQQSVLAKPLWIRKLLAKYYRWRSRRHQKTATQMIMDVNQQAVVDIFDCHQSQILIHGHTHQPGIHWFKTNKGFCKRITLSDWHQEPHALFCYEDGHQDLCALDATGTPLWKRNSTSGVTIKSASI